MSDEHCLDLKKEVSRLKIQCTDPEMGADSSISILMERIRERSLEGRRASAGILGHDKGTPLDHTALAWFSTGVTLVAWGSYITFCKDHSCCCMENRF